MDSYQSIRARLQSDRVTKATREALLRRLEAPPVRAPRFFSPQELKLLGAVCARLIPDSGFADIAGQIDSRLAEGKTDGWRHAALPPDGEAYKQGLDRINRFALEHCKKPFIKLRSKQQDEVLHRARAEGCDSQHFFEDLLAEAIEVYYSHPLAQAEIGYEGFADAHGWFLEKGSPPREQF
ncbi:MAG: hypothetical protein C4332_02535 [Meiothermus sp.]